jgi:hypothetical protein
MEQWSRVTGLLDADRLGVAESLGEDLGSRDEIHLAAASPLRDLHTVDWKIPFVEHPSHDEGTAPQVSPRPGI